MLRIVILGCGALGAYVAGKKVIEVFHEKASGGGGTRGSPMNVIARGVKTLQSQLGPWSVQDLSVGLAAIAKVSLDELFIYLLFFSQPCANCCKLVLP